MTDEQNRFFPLAEQVLADMAYDHGKITTYINLLRDDMACELDRLEQAALTGDRVAFRNSAHALKGLCGYLRDPRPAELARRLYGDALVALSTDLIAALLQLRSICACLNLEKELNDIHGE
jgi:HPt (histidine-containing phosphotransfer) domain-containing protein